MFFKFQKVVSNLCLVQAFKLRNTVGISLFVCRLWGTSLTLLFTPGLVVETCPCLYGLDASGSTFSLGNFCFAIIILIQPMLISAISQFCLLLSSFLHCFALLSSTLWLCFVPAKEIVKLLCT